MAEATLQRQTSALERPLWAALALDWEKAAYAVLIVLAIVTRFVMLDARVMSHDESLHTFYSWELYQGKGFVHTPLMHGTFQFHFLALTYALFGANDFTARIPVALFGVAAVALMWGFRKWLGRTGALLGALFMLISPFMLYYSRYVRNESFVVVWGLLMALALFNYMERREAKWLYTMVAATSLMYTTKEVSYIYVAIWMLFLGFIFLYEMFKANWDNSRYRQIFIASIGLAIVAGAAAGALFAVSQGAGDLLSTTATAVPSDPNAPITAASEPVNPIKQGAAIAFVSMLGLFLLAGLMCLLQFRERLRDYAVDDLLIVLGTFVLPQLTAFPVRLLLKADPLDYSQAGILKTATVFVPLFLLSVGAGVLWDWKKWLICAGIFYGIFVPLFTTMFTNGNGFWSGIVGSLGYWLDQQPVQRGSQPWYFYLLVQTPVYEFLPAIGALIAAGLGLARLSRTKDVGETLNVDSPTGAHKFPALLFIGFWAVMAMIGYSAAGEKMPWLEVHVTFPMILLAGWAFGQILDAVDWAAFREQLGWAAALVVPLVLYGFGYALIVLLGTTPPFQGNELTQLQATNSFLMALFTAIGGAAGLYYLSRRLGWREIGIITANGIGLVLVFFTMRAAFYASYVNYDNQTEFINYASGAPGVKTVMAQVEEISRRASDGKGIRVAYDDDVSWPMTWYMRDFTGSVYYGNQPSRETFQDTPLVIAGDSNWARVEPYLGKDYYSFEYIRMWWPMQEYFNLDKGLEGRERLLNAITDPQYREAILDIWLYRDYTKYGTLTNVDYSLSRWPVADRMRFYIRKDMVAQLWSLGVGPVALAQQVEDPYLKNKLSLAAELTWGSNGTGEGQFTSPRAVAVAPDGSVYVADTKGNRIEHFTADGQFIRAWGSLGEVENGTAHPGTFHEIWGLAVDKDGNVFAADTWNYRVQKFTADGEFITMWGSFGQADAGQTALYGPRGLAVDKDGNVYVADTGNKRILVFNNNGEPLRSIGVAGVLDGELDEPTSVAVAEDGRVFVADTWNRRVQVFSNDGLFLNKWEISGWAGTSLDNKPYIALDGQGNVFVSDPEGYRVIAFTASGEFLYMFGDYGADNSTFSLPAGLAVGNGKLYVVDGNNDRVLQFGLSTGQ
jgi:uncharacterized protein (TIGR03663 family)